MKYVWSILIILLTAFFVTSVKAEIVNNSEINSLKIIDYLKEIKKLEKVKYICANNYCSKEMYGNREKEIKRYIDNYISKIKEKSLEEGIKVELKGFKITKIVFNDF